MPPKLHARRDRSTRPLLRTACFLLHRHDGRRLHSAKRTTSSRHIRAPRDDAFRTGSYLRRGETSRNCLVARSGGIRRDTGRRTVIGGTKDNRLICANRSQIQNRG
jgi:hypothetical protein